MGFNSSRLSGLLGIGIKAGRHALLVGVCLSSLAFSGAAMSADDFSVSIDDSFSDEIESYEDFMDLSKDIPGTVSVSKDKGKSVTADGRPMASSLSVDFSTKPEVSAKAGKKDTAVGTGASKVGTSSGVTGKSATTSINNSTGDSVVLSVNMPGEVSAPSVNNTTKPGGADSKAGSGKAKPHTTGTVAVKNTPPLSLSVEDGEKTVIMSGGKRKTLSSGETAAAPDDTGLSVVLDIAGKGREDADVYYDASAVLPQGFGENTGIRKVNPRLEPAQKYVVVEKVRGAGSFEAMRVSADRALALGRYPAAASLYEKLSRKNRRDPRILMGLAVAQQKMGHTESAIRTYERVLKIAPDNVEARGNMLELLTQKHPAVAMKKLKQLWERNPDNAGVAAQIGLVSANFGDYDQALKYLQIAASLEPDNASHIYNMAVVSDLGGRTKDAIVLYEKALEIDASNDGGGSIAREEVYERLAVIRKR